MCPKHSFQWLGSWLWACNIFAIPTQKVRNIVTEHFIQRALWNNKRTMWTEISWTFIRRAMCLVQLLAVMRYSVYLELLKNFPRRWSFWCRPLNYPHCKLCSRLQVITSFFAINNAPHPKTRIKTKLKKKRVRRKTHFHGFVCDSGPKVANTQPTVWIRHSPLAQLVAYVL